MSTPTQTTPAGTPSGEGIQVTEKAAEQIEKSVGKVADKAQRVHQNRAGKGERQVRRLNNALAPRGLPQDRVLGPLQYHVRHGAAWVDALWNELPALASEHLVIHLEDDGDDA